MLSILSCKICNLEKYPAQILDCFSTAAFLLHQYFMWRYTYTYINCTTIFVQSLPEVIVQSSLEVKLFSFPILFLTLIELSTEKIRNDQAEEGCTCEHLSCQILVFPLMLVFCISPKFRTWNSKGCHCELN